MRASFVFLAVAWSAAGAQPVLRFAVLGDRTGEDQPGVYESIWRQIRSEKPAFVLGVGDTIQGLEDRLSASEWRDALKIVTPPWQRRLYLAPGNHDVWSDPSARLFQQYARHPLHYSFDYQQVHVTVLDNSRSEQLSPEELSFLEADLQAHAAQPVKFIVSHRPSWIFNVMLHNPEFALHRIARKYGVQYVLAGHVHQMLRAELDGIEYLSVESSGGHLRASMKYEDGWFFGHALVTVQGTSIQYKIEELAAPLGKARVTGPADWGVSGLLEHRK